MTDVSYSMDRARERTVSNYSTATEVASAAASLDPNLLDAESMLAFFTTQMGNVKAKLGALLQTQELMNKRVEKLQLHENFLTQFGDKDMRPDDPNWGAFVAELEKLRELVGKDSEAGQKITDAINAGTAGGQQTISISQADDPYAETTAKKKAEALGGTWENKGGDATGANVYEVKYFDPSKAAGLNKSQIDSLKGEIRAHREGIQGDAQLRMIQVQSYVEQCSQIVNLATNIMRKLNDMAMAPINNMR